MEIKLYGLECCKPCKQLKHLLDKFNVKYTYIDVLKEKHPEDIQSYPTLVITFTGFSEGLTEFLRTLGKKEKEKKYILEAIKLNNEKTISQRGEKNNGSSLNTI